ncbi:MAG: prolyl oligopeptidase family serine peptidase [Sphingosinicella sp.]|nr:prolyl oligopeptidase family serine peptidase [Sphingosinicella sp.]
MTFAGILAAAFLALSPPAAVTAAVPGIEQLETYHADDTSYQAFIEKWSQQDQRATFMRDNSERDWSELKRAGALRAQTFVYRADGLRIKGFVVRQAAAGEAAPILIWAGGGVGRVRLYPPEFVQMASWARRGYIVIASGYRGSEGSEGSDEFAGRDVNDLHALSAIARQMFGPRREFAIGFSRGGLMLHKAIAEGLPTAAYATIGSPTELKSLAANRKDLAERFREMMPDFEQERRTGYCRRSPVCWPERIGAPIFIVHGGGDGSIEPAQSWILTKRLEEVAKPYRLLVISQADHGLSGHKADAYERIHSFFVENSATRPRPAGHIKITAH